MTYTITKALAEVVPAEDDGDSPNGSFDLILSAQTLDRDGDTLKQFEWLPLPDWIPMDVDHGMSVVSTVGSGTPQFDDDGSVRVRGTYASTPLAQETRTLVREGHVRFASVAFRNDKSLQKDGKPFRELLNGGFVNTPSNREAVILESKALDARAKELAAGLDDGKSLSEMVTDRITPDEQPKGIYIKVLPDVSGFQEALVGALAETLGVKAQTSATSTSDTALLQAAHDALVHLAGGPGALCIVMEPDVDEGSGADEGANKSADEMEIETPAVEAEIKSPEILVPEGMTLEQFKTAVDAMLTSQESESPVEEPAPAVEAAAASDTADDAADVAARARAMQMSLQLASRL